MPLLVVDSKMGRVEDRVSQHFLTIGKHGEFLCSSSDHFGDKEGSINKFQFYGKLIYDPEECPVDQEETLTHKHLEWWPEESSS